MSRLSEEQLLEIDVHNLSSVMLRSLWAMERLAQLGDLTVGPTAIAKHLVEIQHISTTKQAVDMALKRAIAEGFVHKESAGYRIMRRGQQELLSSSSVDRVVFIEPGKPFTAGTKIDSIFSAMKGSLSISDPYVDLKTLDVFYRAVPKSLPISLLTCQINDGTVFRRDLSKLKTEGFNIDVRTMSPGTLHDRYFFDDSVFWLSGNSLNNLGRKESFIVRLGSDMRSTVLPTFQSRWNNASKI